MIRTLAGEARHEDVVKRSRFLAAAAAVDDPEHAARFLQAQSRSDANHNCWAWRFGESCRSSDDGEPGGTAGRPILAAIDGAELDRVVVVVTRYFGGVKLGAGGLVRAYGGAAARCLAGAEIRFIVPRITMTVTVAFDHLGILHGLVHRFGAERGRESYTGDGVSLPVSLPATASAAFMQSLEDQTRGSAVVSPSG